jgi:hypothetical protein
MIVGFCRDYWHVATRLIAPAGSAHWVKVKSPKAPAVMPKPVKRAIAAISTPP